LRNRAFALLLIGVATPLAGCQSTQDKSAELEKAAEKIANRKGLEVRTANPDVKVLNTTLLQSDYGVAVAVELRNESNEGMRNLLISVDAYGAKGKTVFENNAPGLEPSLISISAVEPGETVTWVNDQILATGKAKLAKVKVGSAEPLPAELPEIEVSEPQLEVDPVSGIEATGTVLNKSGIVQETLVLYAVARKGGKVVAAGRGAIDRLKTDGKPVNYHIFFIGNPKGAEVSVIAPPTTLEAGATPQPAGGTS
jgi:hypothetical protein